MCYVLWCYMLRPANCKLAGPSGTTVSLWELGRTFSSGQSKAAPNILQQNQQLAARSVESFDSGGNTVLVVSTVCWKYSSLAGASHHVLHNESVRQHVSTSSLWRLSVGFNRRCRKLRTSISEGGREKYQIICVSAKTWRCWLCHVAALPPSLILGIWRRAAAPAS